MLAPIIEIGRQAVAVVQEREDAGDILVTLGELVRFEAAELAYWDPLAGTHRVLVNWRYPPEVLDYINGDFVDLCPGYVHCRQSAWPQRMCDSPFDFRQSDTFRECLGPAGYDEGMTACLVTADGRYTGMLNLSTAGNDPSDLAREGIGRLSATLAEVTDASRTPAWLAATLEPGSSAVAVSPEGGVIELPGCAVSETLLEPDLLARARDCALQQTGSVRFIWEDETHGMHSVRILRAPAGLLDGRQCALMVIKPCEPPYDLTPRELDVLTLTTHGFTNREIGVCLFMSPRTVSTHMEHILDKLDQQTRTGAAGLAAREGILRFPAPTR